jgi:endoglycosylceramidase
VERKGSRRVEPSSVRRLRLLSSAAAITALTVATPTLAAGRQHRHDDAMSWLSVAHPQGARAQIIDTTGRTVMLRGVNVAGVEDDVYAHTAGHAPGPAPLWPADPASYDGTCPANSHAGAEPPLCEVDAGQPEFAQSSAAGSRNDLAQIRALGFNVIRLTVSWSLLEPTAGHYNPTYVARIAQVVEWARQQRVYVLLDMHQDAYSRYTPETAAASAPPLLESTYEGGDHADGAPPWAVVTDGEPALAVAGQGELNAYVAAAFTNFWLNRVPDGAAQGQAPGAGLQDHYIGAVAALAQRFRHDPTVVGYELMNEPLPGYLPPPAFDAGYLFPFYRRVIDAVTGIADDVTCPTGTPYAAACGYADLGVHDQRHLFFVEPMAARNLVDVAPGVSAPFTSYPNVVYAPHLYTHVFTAETQLPDDGGGVYPPSYDFGLQTADAEARAIGAALWVGEYGNSNGADATVLAAETAAQDRALVGSALWQWKANCGTGPCDMNGLWAVYAADTATAPVQNGALIPSRERYLARIYPLATAGTLQSFGYDPIAHSFAMSASDSQRVPRGARDRETVVYLPATLTSPVHVTGAAVLDEVVAQPDGSRLAYVAPTGAGAYGLTLP